MNKTLYISDLDGTLLNKQAKLSDYSKEALNKLIGAGVAFTASTSRDARAVMRIFEGVGLKLPVSVLNGTMVYDPVAGAYIRSKLIGKDAIAKFMDLLGRFSESALITSLIGGLPVVSAAENAKSQYQRYMEFGYKRDPSGFNKSLGYPDTEQSEIIYITMWDEGGILEPIYQEANKIPHLNALLYKDVYNEGLFFLECCGEGATKADSALFLKELYGFDWLIGFGDNLNDIPLLNACDEKYAVEGARGEVKALATGVIGEASQDAVAKWIESREAAGV